MAEVIHDAQHEFWSSPATLEHSSVDAALPAPQMAEACAQCGTEYLIGAKFCHACGVPRPHLTANATTGAEAISSVWFQRMAFLKPCVESATHYWRKIAFPQWLRYLHFHEIKRAVGLPTAALIAFIVGLGCVAGAVAVSLFYKASTLAEFQAIQMWRIEWLLAATASFVAGILLKKPSDID
jgi:hypothetical protein